MSISERIAAAVGALLIAGSALAQPAPAAPASAAMHHEGHRAAACASPALACAHAASAAFDARGTLWVAWAAAGSVSVARSTDAGGTFGPASVIDSPGAALDAGSDARPQIVVDARGRIVVAYAAFKDKAWNAQVLVATSSDGGASFSAPRSLSRDAASQRFPVLALRSDGRLFALWIDKRTVAAARRKGVPQAGAALAYAWSDDGGESFTGERIVQDHSCECCRLAMAFDTQRHPVVLYRSLFADGERDHALLTIPDDGEAKPPSRVAEDHWFIDGCPHHGPSVAVSPDGTVHAAWFTQGQARQGLFQARSTDGGATFSNPQRVGDAAQQPGRPAVYAQGRAVWLVWKEFDGQRIFIKERRSADAGQTWSPDRVLAATANSADHPLLIGDGRRVYLSWLTRDEGYRLMPLEAP
ncbi:MAG: hypothetical protein B7Y51_03180 [Burkholderiales bacterium 28-67-8]|nr:MAG: hypothetical protein B7Y51_03180 [Burkholderiales bacterium 28-67-8]